MTPSIGLITCSQRSPRAGPQITTFIQSTILQSHPTANLTVIDLAEWNLPMYNEPGMPSYITSADEYVHEHTKAWSREIARHDAFIFITPQYNWGYPASVKNAIDYLFHEWKGKPALVIGVDGWKMRYVMNEVMEFDLLNHSDGLLPYIPFRRLDNSRRSPLNPPPLETITCDICILGGGSSGTYSAVRLKDAGKHVVVVEPNNRLGGHTETLYLPDDHYVDYGVEGVFSDELSKNYLRRLGVEWKSLLPSNKKTEYVDFTTGERVDPPAGVVNILLSTFHYRSAIKHWTGLLKGVYDLPDPVPEELLRPFGEFVEKHSLDAALQLIFLFAHTVGNILELPTLYAIQFFGVPHVDALLRGYITPRNGMDELYQEAGKELGRDVLLQTTAVETKRSDSGVDVTVQHANGTRKLIKARNLLITFPPIMEKLRGFDLDAVETEMFEKWVWRNYYVAVLNNTGIPDQISVINTDPKAGPGDLPHMPFDYLLQYMGAPGHLTSKLLGDMDFTAEDAKNLMASDFARMKAKGTYPIENPHIVAFGDHSPSAPIVSPEEIRNGFYRKLYALQGRRSTYYTGLTFCSDYSSLLWAYSDTVIEKMKWGM
ncbi:hypothetical protein BO94DRAFT_570995 [Aspergillus sclerotioniger CBS 115572]|uniref:FAD/NAD(P)-binding domain-containing protein n=1 Tax=Aspergillus sclerotioniger CBS 115572 TaxID=1450535 RepID=A0A317XDY3_9EURO|nr:hypothetical protein BO94DRAFT_570995 [Aspergillus sclerotioniger CBS 115572]PWY96749.1 hypothetical protein BO94DRAFT_570995 [Aspergillus sclerotioniger CBS 115572]